MMVKSDIQIWGLPRTGTNYLEYLIINNVNCTYINSHKKLSDYFKYNSKVALKHTKPSNTHSKYHIILLKTSGNFIKSFTKWKKCSVNEAIITYKKAICDYIKFYNENKDQCVIVFHEDLINNEKLFISKIIHKFNLRQRSKDIISIDKRMDKSGGEGYTNKKYEFVNHDEIKINDNYDEIKKLKLDL